MKKTTKYLWASGLLVTVLFIALFVILELKEDKHISGKDGLWIVAKVATTTLIFFVGKRFWQEQRKK